MTTTYKNLPKGYYFVQDMHGPARPCYYDGVLFRNYKGETGTCPGLSWHWPTFRVISQINNPTDEDVRARREQEQKGL